MVASTVKSTKSTPYKGDFQLHLINHGIYPPRYKYPSGEPAPEPSNLAEIRSRSTMRRASLDSDLDELYERFCDELASCRREAEVSSCIPMLRSKTDDPYLRSMDLAFTNFLPLTDGTIVPAQPDVYYGARPDVLLPEIQEACNGLVVPSSDKTHPILPNFFVALKGPRGTRPVAESQACYDGALGARGLTLLTSIGAGKQVLEDQAYTITSTLQDGVLRMYTSHLYVSRDPRRSWECAMTSVCSHLLDAGPDQFRGGVTAYRNLNEWAQEYRDDKILSANNGPASTRDELLQFYSNNSLNNRNVVETTQTTRRRQRSSVSTRDVPNGSDRRSRKRTKLAKTPPIYSTQYNLRSRPQPLHR